MIHDMFVRNIVKILYNLINTCVASAAQHHFGYAGSPY